MKISEAGQKSKIDGMENTVYDVCLETQNL